MTDRQDDSAHERHGRLVGWVSGLALLVVPWIIAGVLATAVTTVGPASWDAETTFPWLLLAAYSAGIGWIVYGCVRIQGFRHGALPGTAVALIMIAGILGLTLAVAK
jgi:hypothetical protein